MGSRLTRIVLVLLAAVGVPLAIAMYASSMQPRILEGMQRRSHAALRRLKARVDADVRRAGGPPPSIRPVRDGWGHEVLYLTDGRGFVIVSPGRDGKPDREGYEDLLASAPAPADQPGREGPRDICGFFDADEVLTDRGWVAACGE